MKKLFLLFFIIILLYLSLLFLDKPLAIKFSPSFSESAVIAIEPMVTPPVIEISEHEETLLKLKLAVDDAISKDDSFEENEADSILAILKENVPVFVTPPLVQQYVVPPVPIKKKIVTRQKIKRVKAKIDITKKVIVKKQVTNLKPHFIKAHVNSVKRSKKKIHLTQVKVKTTPSVKSKKRETFLGEQDDLHYLSKEERENFKNFEVVSVSKPFVLEAEQKIKSPERYRGVQQEVKFEDLAFVETLGVVNVSTPSIYPNELIKR